MRRPPTAVEESHGEGMSCSLVRTSFVSQADPDPNLDSDTDPDLDPNPDPDPNPIRSFIAGNFRNAAHIIPCYGKNKYDPYAKRPVLCSGTVLGTREGMHRFLSVLVTEFHNNNHKEHIIILKIIKMKDKKKCK